MNDFTKKAAQDLLADPLSSVTRTAKKSMIVLASLCCLISYTGIMPEEAIVLGFKFPGLTTNFIRWALFWLLLYSYLTFFIYLVADYLRSRILLDRYNRALAHEVDEASSTPPDDEQDHFEQEFRYISGYREKGVSHRSTKATHLGRVVLDFVFPVIYGIASAIYFLCRRP